MAEKLIFWASRPRTGGVWEYFKYNTEKNVSECIVELSDKRYENKLEDATKQTLKPLKPLAILSQDQVYNS